MEIIAMILVGVASTLAAESIQTAVAWLARRFKPRPKEEPALAASAVVNTVDKLQVQNMYQAQNMVWCNAGQSKEAPCRSNLGDVLLTEP